jgi:hypothetical protein
MKQPLVMIQRLTQQLIILAMEKAVDPFQNLLVLTMKKGRLHDLS